MASAVTETKTDNWFAKAIGKMTTSCPKANE